MRCLRYLLALFCAFYSLQSRADDVRFLATYPALEAAGKGALILTTWEIVNAADIGADGTVKPGNMLQLRLSAPGMNRSRSLIANAPHAQFTLRRTVQGSLLDTLTLCYFKNVKLVDDSGLPEWVVFSVGEGSCHNKIRTYPKSTDRWQDASWNPRERGNHVELIDEYYVTYPAVANKPVLVKDISFNTAKAFDKDGKLVDAKALEIYVFIPHLSADGTLITAAPHPTFDFITVDNLGGRRLWDQAKILCSFVNASVKPNSLKADADGSVALTVHVRAGKCVASAVVSRIKSSRSGFF